MVVELKAIGSTPKSNPVNENGLLEVVVSIEIAADWSRVFHAITLPEYIEAWLQVPDPDRIECHSECKSLTRFRIDLLSVNKPRRNDLRLLPPIGARWHDLPERYGKYKSVHGRFMRWARAGVWSASSPIWSTTYKRIISMFIELRRISPNSTLLEN
jgi:hypothetical protein